ncbi:MAG: response regulator [Crocinitomicaceae bacterium]|nr:response regulator [Crocinitomicaceae bacterium]
MKRKTGTTVKRMMFIMLLMFSFVIVAGVVSFERYVDVIRLINTEVKPNEKLLTAEKLRNNLSTLELSAKSYNITQDSSFIVDYNKSLHKIESKLYDLEKHSSYNSLSNDDLPVISQLDSLINKKIFILNEFIKLKDKYRADEALEKVSDKIKFSVFEMESETDKATYEKKRKFFDRLFRRELASNEYDKTSKINFQTIEQEIESVRSEEFAIESLLKFEEYTLVLEDQKVSLELNKLLVELRENEANKLAHKTLEAEQSIDDAYNQLIVFFLFLGVLIIFMGYLLYDYFKQNRRYYKALRLARREAEDLARTKQMFLANISHEIRTPLNAIFGFTEQIAKTPLNKEQQEQIDIVRKSSLHLLDLINDVLDFSKLQMGQIELERVPINLKKEITDIFSLFEEEAQRKNIELASKIDPEVPPKVIGDIYRFKQILMNLLSNAVKFTDQGKVTVEISNKSINGKSVVLSIDVIDTGIGMTKKQIEKVFNEFEQAEPGITRTHGGTGLGLSIVKKLVELKGGYIHMSSEPGKGTTVSLTLPYELPLKKQDDQGELDEEIITNIPKDLNVLIVDDESFNRQLIAKILKNHGCKFKQAENGLEASKLAKKEQFDVILMDTRMPEMNGVEATKKIRNDEGKSRHAGIIALTAAVSTEDRVTYTNSGMDGFLAKPFKEQELVTEINRVVAADTTQNTTAINKNKINGKNMSEKINFDPLLKACDNDVPFFLELLTTFITSTNKGIEDIKFANQSGDKELVADVAHRIASPCGQIGADQLHSSLKDLEKICMENGDQSQIDELIKQIEVKAGEAIDQVQQELKNHKTASN